MMIRSLKELVERASSMEKRTCIAVVAAHDRHTLEAVTEAKKMNIATPILIGDKGLIEEILTSLSEDISCYEVIHCTEVDESVEIASSLVSEGRADAIMKGKLQTGEIMRGLLKKESGLRGSRNLSITGLFDFERYGKIFGITDVAITPHPDLKAKRDILMNALDLLHSLGLEEPKVACITASETVHPKQPETEDAARLKDMYINGELGKCIVEGPISLDLATDMESAKIKGYESPVAGNADLFLMPDLVSANVFAKCITGMAGGKTAGIVLGARVPVILVSRSASAEEKYYAIALASCAAPYLKEKFDRQ